jgi:hypothetical protein
MAIERSRRAGTSVTKQFPIRAFAEKKYLSNAYPRSNGLAFHVHSFWWFVPAHAVVLPRNLAREEFRAIDSGVSSSPGAWRFELIAPGSS